MEPAVIQLLSALLGGVLGGGGAVLAMRQQQIAAKRQNSKAVKDFLHDLISNITDLSEKYEDIRNRMNFIDKEFNLLIQKEVSAYNNNRQHLVAIDDGKLRRRVNSFFSRCEIGIIKINFSLEEYYRILGEARDYDKNSNEHHVLTRKAEDQLLRAHKESDALRMFLLSEKDILEHLK